MTVFYTPTREIPTLFNTPTREIPTLFYNPTREIPTLLYTSSLKRYPFRAEPPRIVHHREYPLGVVTYYFGLLSICPQLYQNKAKLGVKTIEEPSLGLPEGGRGCLK